MKLSEICEVNPKGLVLDSNTNVSFVAMPDVSEDGKISTSDIRKYHEVKKGYTSFIDGDVLLAKITPCMENGKGALATGLINGIGFGSTEFHVLRPLYGKADGKWLYYFTVWPGFRKDAERNMTGSAGQKRVPKDFLEKYDLFVPPLEMQRLQVQQLDSIKGLIDLRKSQLSYCDHLIKARFVEMFGTYPANEKDWPTGAIRDLVTDVRYGSSRKAAEGDSGRYPYLRMNNITYGGELDLTDVKTIDIPEEELDKCSVRYGDLLFNRTNSKELVGKTCVYNREELMVLAGFVVRVRLNEKALPEFVSAFLNSDFSKKMLLGMCKAAIGQANINAQELQSIGIYIPPLDMQKTFVEFVAQINKTKSVIQKSLDETQILFDSLMHRYFG